MSEPIRYSVKCGDEGYTIVESLWGDWVRFGDYARLKAEVERLRASSFVTAVPVEQYERVIKAGDAMAKRTEFFQKRWDADELCQEVEAWNAAKEGKPSEQKSPSFIEDLGNGVEKHDLLFRYPAKEGKQP